ncbi:MAG: restriction endonuclease subunit S [Paludibacteraceae bacterium]|nr:restriction endonuclease subunit S [Paludibacteraceae bacterium]
MEWITVKLGEVITIKYGKDHKALGAGNVPVYGSGGIMRYADKAIYDKPSILIPRKGSLNNIFYVDKPFWTVDTMFWSIIDTEKADPHFLFYAICKLDFAGLNVGSAVPSLTVPVIEAVEFSLPPIETQRRIAAILSSLDDKIENNNRINRNLEAQAQALFKSWFVDFEPWGGVMQEDWKDGTLDEICTQLREKVGRKDDVKVLSPVTTGNLMLSEEYFTKQVYSQSIAKYIVVPPTAFAYNPARVNIGSLGMNEFDFDGCVSPVYVVFECKDGYEYFFDLFRRTNQFKEEVKSRAIGGVRQTLGYDDFKSIQTVIPPKRIVDEFNKIYTSMLDVSNANKRENQYLAALRDTLLPKLMRGEITL